MGTEDSGKQDSCLCQRLAAKILAGACQLLSKEISHGSLTDNPSSNQKGSDVHEKDRQDRLANRLSWGKSRV